MTSVVSSNDRGDNLMCVMFFYPDFLSQSDRQLQHDQPAGPGDGLARAPALGRGEGRPAESGLHHDRGR